MEERKVVTGVRVNPEVQGLRMVARGLGDDVATGPAGTLHLLVPRDDPRF